MLALALLPVIGEHAREPPVLVGNLLYHDMRMFGFLAQDPSERIRDLYDKLSLETTPTYWL